jgi:signal transduction histidine kinase/ActR/RegA family two-component response regulator
MLVAAMMPILLLIAFAWFDYVQVRSRARDHVLTTTGALAEHAQKVIETVDLTLARMLDHVDNEDWGTIAESREIHDFLYQLEEQLPQVQSAFLVGPDGLNAASSRGFPLPRIFDTGREYFQAALHGNDGLFVSAPFKGKIARTYAFTVTRPRLRNGAFDGLAGVTISPEYFEAFYRAVLDHPKQSYAALLRDDGALLVRVPEPAARPLRLGPSPMLAAAVSAASGGVVDGVSDVDGHRRIQAFRRLQGVPLIVGFGIDHALYLRDWSIHVGFFAVLAALLSGTILLAGHAMSREAAREHEALRRLVAETTRRQEAEAALQQLQKMEALGRIAGGVAHDFNNLLTAILGCVELLQKRVTDPRSTRLLTTAGQAAERGAQLTAQMLAFSRRQEVAIQSIDVNATIRGIDALVRRATGSPVAIRYELADTLWPAVADPVQVEMALINLAVNARDAMPHGGTLTIATGAVAVTGAPGDPPGLAPADYVRIIVADTGEGMSEEVRARALEPFFTTKGPSKGTGLGLSMIFGFASMVGGTVTLDSAPGQGTSVSLYLPRAQGVPVDRAATPAPSSAMSGVDRHVGRVLLVDDDENVRATIRTMLEELGLEVIAATGAREGLAIATVDRGFDVVLVDFAMPVMNGSQFAAEIEGFWPDAPLLFVTGFAENEQLRPWLERGIPTLDKPFTQVALTAALSRAARTRTPPVAAA